MGKTLKYGSHEFPSKFGFSRSSKSGPVTVRSHTRKRSAPKAPKASQKMASGGVPTPADYMPSPSAGLFPEAPVTPSAVPGMRPAGPNAGGNAMSHQEQMGEGVKRGYADLTAENVAKAIGFGLSLSGTSPMSIAVGEALKAATGEDLGMGLPSFTGKENFLPETAAAINAGKFKTIEQAARFDKNRRAEMAAQNSPGAGAEGHEQGQSPGAGPGGRGVKGGGAYGGMGGVGSHGMKKGGAIRRMQMAEGGKVTMPKVRAAVEKKVMEHNHYPNAHRNMKAVPAFRNKPKFGDE